jgi:autotransporter-associated beta strand protein
VTITGGATATGNNSNFILNGFAITSNGSGYTAAPAVGVSGGTATATANVSAINLASDASIGGSGDLAINPGISGNYALTKVGAGTATLAGVNTYAGATNVSAGKLVVSGNLSGSTQVNVSGGSLQLGASNVINGSAAVNLSGGNFNTGGFSQGDAATVGLGLLTVSANSVIDFGATAGSQLMFAGVGTHPAGTLSIENWSGTPMQAGGASDDRLMFAGNSAALQTFENLYAQSDISFNGVQGYEGIQLDATHFEITAVPEPSSTVVISGATLIALATYRGRRRNPGTLKRKVESQGAI